MKNSGKKLVLALGESTHTHVMESKKPIEWTEKANEEIDFILQELGIITHEEHNKIVLKAGVYRKYPQMEYDPFQNEMRFVFD